jgi:hypothetical protein
MSASRVASYTFNTDDDWNWMSGDAADAGRWLGYVPFERISDARNEEADLFIPEYNPPGAYLVGGGETRLPEASELDAGFRVSFVGGSLTELFSSPKRAVSGQSFSPSLKSSVANCSR